MVEGTTDPAARMTSLMDPILTAWTVTLITSPVTWPSPVASPRLHAAGAVTAAVASSRKQMVRRMSTKLLSPKMFDELDVYGEIGEDGFARLVRGFYSQVPGDDVLGPMYPAEDLAGAETRLRDFLVGRFGGPQRYIEARGHPRLRARHAPFVIDQRARDRWVSLMMRALDAAALPANSDRVLRKFFEDTATFMINRLQ